MQQCVASNEECPTIQMLDAGRLAAYDTAFEFYWVSPEDKQAHIDRIEKEFNCE